MRMIIIYKGGGVGVDYVVNIDVSQQIYERVWGYVYYNHHELIINENQYGQYLLHLI